MTFSDLIIHCKYSKRLMKVLYLRIMVLLQRAQIRNTQMKTHIEWSLGRNSELLCTFLKNLSTLTSWHDNVLSSQEAPLSPDVHMFYWGFITYVWMIKLLAIQWNLNSSSFPAFPRCHAGPNFQPSKQMIRLSNDHTHTKTTRVLL